MSPTVPTPHDHAFSVETLDEKAARLRSEQSPRPDHHRGAARVTAPSTELHQAADTLLIGTDPDVDPDTTVVNSAHRVARWLRTEAGKPVPSATALAYARAVNAAHPAPSGGSK